MACFYLLHGYRARKLSKNGKRPIVFDVARGYVDMPVTIPCGRCIGCRLDLSRQWSIRCHHETQYWDQNSYITLTYRNENLPTGASLLKSDFQDFMKRVRKKYSGKTIRYYHSGEYGNATNKNGWIARPHYHALLFNLDFEDLEHFKTVNGIPLYKSNTLRDLWTHGHVSVGRVTLASAAYVARYIMKKQFKNKNNPDEVLHHYAHIDLETGEWHNRLPEYSTMSRNIGKQWFDEFHPEIYRNDFLTIKGEQYPIPKAYDRYFEKIDPIKLAKIKAVRRSKIIQLPVTRLQTLETVKILRTNRLIRSLSEHSNDLPNTVNL